MKTKISFNFFDHPKPFPLCTPLSAQAVTAGTRRPHRTSTTNRPPVTGARCGPCPECVGLKWSDSEYDDAFISSAVSPSGRCYFFSPSSQKCWHQNDPFREKKRTTDGCTVKAPYYPWDGRVARDGHKIEMDYGSLKGERTEREEVIKLGSLTVRFLLHQHD